MILVRPNRLPPRTFRQLRPIRRLTVLMISSGVSLFLFMSVDGAHAPEHSYLMDQFFEDHSIYNKSTNRRHHFPRCQRMTLDA